MGRLEVLATMGLVQRVRSGLLKWF